MAILHSRLASEGHRQTHLHSPKHEPLLTPALGEPSTKCAFFIFLARPTSSKPQSPEDVTIASLGWTIAPSVESAVPFRSPPRMGTGVPAFSFPPPTLPCQCLPRAGDSHLQRGSKLIQKVDMGTIVPTNFCPKCFFPCQFPTDKILVEKSKNSSQLLHYKPF